MALRINDKNEIEITRGDTAYLTVPIYIVDEHGELPVDADGNQVLEEYPVGVADTLVLSVKRTTRDKTLCFQKVLTGANTFHIKPEDTAGCDFAKYKYDVQLTLENGDVITVIEPTCFRILEEVSY